MAQTHALTFAGSVITKRYVSWERDEQHREWAVLRHLDRHAPGLAPRPLAGDLDATPPSITMSVVPGRPLAGTPAAPQLDALAAAVTALWAVPCDGLPSVCRWRDDLRFAGRLAALPRPARGITAVAYDAAVAWSQGPDAALLRTPPEVRVVGHRDPNLANYLWDGRRIRIVDFEDAAVSDPATELAVMVEHLSARSMDAEALCGRFEVDQRRFLAARRLWAISWLALLLPGGSAVHRNPPGTADVQAGRVLALLDRG